MLNATTALKKSLPAFFENIPDPRTSNSHYSLNNIMLLATVAIACGCTDYVMMADFCKAKKHVFKWIFNITKIPSHDTFNRVFNLLDNAHFEQMFRVLVGNVLNLTAFGLNHIAMDGKSVTNSNLHVVTAYSTTAGLSLASQDTGKGKKNELATMVNMVKMLKLQGCVITTDAMGCNDQLTSAIIEKKGDYALQVKANQKNALDTVATHFNLKPGDVSFSDDPTKERTGIVTREYFVHSNLKDFPFVSKFTGLKSIVMAKKTIRNHGKPDEVERRYYITSLTDVNDIASSVRKHWGIENNLHWTLDVRFKEDGSTVRNKNGQLNLNLLRKLVINSFKSHNISNFRRHMHKLMWDDNELMQELKSMLA